MLKFMSLGSGSSGNAYLLFTETDCIVIDCGLGIRTIKKHFYSYGLQMSMIKNILVTHDHADHIKSVGPLSEDYKIPVYTTKEVHEGINKNWCVKRKVAPEMVRFIEKGETKLIGEFEVTAFEVPHDSTDCVGYNIICQGISFTIVTDCGHITDEIKKFISVANYLVIEANHEPEKLEAGPYPKYLKARIASQKGHLSNGDCATAITENATPGLRHVWLCHLSDENNHPELARKTLVAAMAAVGLAADRDFAVEVLKRKVPSGVYELV